MTPIRTPAEGRGDTGQWPLVREMIMSGAIFHRSRQPPAATCITDIAKQTDPVVNLYSQKQAENAARLCCCCLASGDGLVLWLYRSQINQKYVRPSEYIGPRVAGCTLHQRAYQAQSNIQMAPLKPTRPIRQQQSPSAIRELEHLAALAPFNCCNYRAYGQERTQRSNVPVNASGGSPVCCVALGDVPFIVHRLRLTDGSTNRRAAGNWRALPSCSILGHFNTPRTHASPWGDVYRLSVIRLNLSLFA